MAEHQKITKDDWLEWTQHPVTEEFIVYVTEKINSETWNLVENAGLSSSKDAKSSGQIIALGDLLNWKPETIMEEVEEVVVVGEESEDE